MGSLNCSCFNSSENGQVVFAQENQKNPENNIIFPRRISALPDEGLFNIISSYYSSKKIEIEKITPQEFSELLTSDPLTQRILEEYEEKLEDLSNAINNFISIGPIKFINVDDEKSEKDFKEFYYEGEYSHDGIINGKGTKIIKNNLIYKGQFSNGEFNGKGLLIKNGGSLYGDWIKGECSGKVIYKVENEFEYNGNFENNKKNGFGVEKYSDGSIYEGNFKDNKKNGKGVYKFNTGEMYEGDFENNLYNGKGKYIWGFGGRKYEGEFKNGVINGKGIYTYDDGTIYNGNFIDGVKNGEGCIEFVDGRKYYGNWLNDELYGNGFLVNGDEKMEVIFRHGKIISTNVNTELDNNFEIINNNEDNLTNKKNIKLNIECFIGDKDNININKYICEICKCFLIQPLKCNGCISNFCKECIDGKNCNICNNNQFKDNDELVKEMMENVKLKCNKCEKILNYQSYLCHFH